MKEMYTGFFEQKPPDELGMDRSNPANPELVHLTPAEVSQVYFRHLPEADEQAVMTDLVTTSHTKRAAAEKSAAALQARRAEEDRRLEEERRSERFKAPEDQDTIGMKPVAEAHTVHGTSVQDMFRSMLES